MQAFQLNFEKGFVLHYPDALGEEKGLIFVLSKDPAGGNAWRLFSVTNGKYLSRTNAPPELHIPSGEIGYIWHTQDMTAEMGFALDPQPDEFDGYVEQIEDGWMIQSAYGQLLKCILFGGFPDKWGWVGQQT